MIDYLEYIENIDKVYLDLRLKKFEILFRLGCKMSKKEVIIISTNKTIKRIVFSDFSFFYIDSSIVANKYYLLNEIFAQISIHYRYI